MKRSTTPAVKQRINTMKFTANLKVASQLKIASRDTRKNVYSKMLPNNNSNSVLQKRQSTSKLCSLDNSYSKKLFSFQKYQKQNSNQQTQCSSPQIQLKEENLTSYLVSKSWENSIMILSSQVNQAMKKLVIEWLIQLSHYMKLKRETLYHSMWIFQRCLQKITDLDAKNLQLLAITCLFISAKYEQIYPPHVLALIQKTMNSYHKKQVIDLQQRILTALNFQLTAPNRYTFVNLATNTSKYLEQYDKQSKRTLNKENFNTFPNQKRYSDFLHYILQLTLLKSFPQTYSEKQIADSVVYLANQVMKRPQTIFYEDDWLYLIKIQQIAYQIIQLWKQNKNSIVSFLYDCDKWNFVGGLTMLF